MKKSHNTNTKFHYREGTVTSEDYIIFLSEITIRKTIRYIGQHQFKAKITIKGKKKENERGKEKENERGKEKEKERG